MQSAATYLPTGVTSFTQINLKHNHKGYPTLCAACGSWPDNVYVLVATSEGILCAYNSYFPDCCSSICVCQYEHKLCICMLLIFHAQLQLHSLFSILFNRTCASGSTVTRAKCCILVLCSLIYICVPVAVQSPIVVFQYYAIKYSCVPVAAQSPNVVL
jgi:hypothetical protein